MDTPRIASRMEWLTARKELLAKEKRFTRERDRLSEERRQLPMVALDKEYNLQSADGPRTLNQLFEDRHQLIVYHFMFSPDMEEGCKSCSFFADNFVGTPTHLAARDTSFAVVSRAPIAKIELFKQRMGWTFPWYSSEGSDFNYDFHVTLDPSAGSVEYNYENGDALREAGKIWMDELPGLSVFLKLGNQVFHTYSTYQRGLDILMGTYNYLDLTPLGRQEDGLPFSMAWVRHHDRYDAKESAIS